jgi:2'-5' RNA ligase
VSRGNYHVTLAFVGAVPGARLDELRLLGRAVQATRCTLVFDAYEYWPKPEVVVAVARVIPAALELAWSALHRHLAEAHFELAPKRLRPHISLARKVTQAPVLPAMSAFCWTPETLCLVRSETVGAESVYTVVDTWQLLDEATRT